MRQAEFYLTVDGCKLISDYQKEFRVGEISKVISIEGGGCFVETEKGNFRVKESFSTIYRKMEGKDY